MDLIRFDRTDHHPVTFAFVADRNFPDFDFHRAVCNDRQTSASVFGRNAQIAVVHRRLGDRVKSETLPPFLVGPVRAGRANTAIRETSCEHTSS